MNASTQGATALTAKDIALMFLGNRGYAIVRDDMPGTPFDLVARNGRDIVLIAAQCTTEGVQPEQIDIEEAERAAYAYATSAAAELTGDYRVRFDIARATILPGNRAFIRHHVNVF